MIKHFVDTFSKCFLLVLAAVTAVLILSGFYFDREGFSSNLTAELAGVTISFLAALLVVDRFVEYQRKKQWAKVRNITLGSIATHLCETTSNLYIYFPIRDHRSLSVILGGRNTPNYTSIMGFDDLLEQLRKLPSNVSKEKSTSDVAAEFYAAVTWDLDQIQTILTPRVIQSSTDQSLINALIDFDEARRNLHHSIIGHKLVGTHSVFPNVISLIESSKNLYQAVCDNLEDPRGM